MSSLGKLSDNVEVNFNSLLQSFDWSKTILGDSKKWSPALKTSSSIIQNSATPGFLCWGKTQVLIYNRAFCELAGREEQDIGLSLQEVWPQLWSIVSPYIENVLKKGSTEQLEDQFLFRNTNSRLSELYLSFSLSPVYDEDQKVQGVYCICHDTTQAIINSRQLKTIEQLHNTLNKSKTEQALYIYVAEALQENSADFPFALFYSLEKENSIACLMASEGIPANHPATQPVIELNSDDGKAALLSKVLETGKALVIEGVQKNFGNIPCGKWTKSTERIEIVPVRSNDEHILGFLVVAHNPYHPFYNSYRSFLQLIAGNLGSAIMALRLKEDSKKIKNRMDNMDLVKSEFVNNISHEFRTPLTLMLSPLEEALNERNPLETEKQKERLELVHRNTQRLLKLVNNLLDFSKLEDSQNSAIYQSTNLNELTLSIINSFRSVIEISGIKLNVSCNLKSPVFVDRVLWEKALVNLLSNAYKYTLKGTITLSLKEENGAAVLKLRDTGVGIPEKDQDKIFERFFRGKNTKSRNYEGSGIGLALVYEIIKLHGGEINVESTAGKGSTFTISLPLGKEHLPPYKIDDSLSVQNTSSNIHRSYVDEILHWASFKKTPTDTDLYENKKTILVADDNADMSDYIVRLLQPHYIVVHAANGKQALQKMREKTPSLVLSDVMMPEMDGFELLQALRNNSATRSIPVILISAQSPEELSRESLNNGADAFLSKPFSAKELLTKVSDTLHLAEVRAAAEKRFQALLLETPIAISFLKGPDLIIESANASILADWGKSEEIIGKELLEAMPELKSQKILADLKKVYTSGKAHYGYEEQVLVEEKGLLRPYFFNFVYQPYREDDGNISGVIVFCTDVGEMAKAKQKIAQNEADYRQLLQGLPTPVYTCDADGYIHLYNEACVTLWGREPEVGKDKWSGAYKLYTSEGKPLAHEDCPMAIAVKEKRAIEGEELIIERTDGSRTYVKTYPKPIHDNDGRLSGALNMLLDITQQKAQEKAVRESETRFEAVANTAPVLIWVADENKHRVFFNKEWLDFRGRSLEQELGEGWQEGIHPDDYDRWIYNYSIYFDSHEDFYLEYRLKRYDGEYRWISIKAVPRFSEDGTFLGYIGGGIDIHERKTARQELERNVIERTQNLKEINITLKKQNEELSKSQAFLNSILNTTLSGIVVYEAIRENGKIIDFRIIHANTGEYSQNGEQRRSVMEMRLLQYYPSAVEKGIFQRYVEVVETGVSQTFETDFTNEDKPRWYKMTISKLNDGVTSSFINISEIKNTNAKLKQQNDFIEAIFEAVVDLIAVFDTEMRYVSVNKRIEEVYKMPREKMIGYKLTDVFPGIEGTEMYNNLERAIKGKAVHNTSYFSPIIKRFYENFFVPLKDSTNKVYGVLVIGHDNTEIIRSAEKLLEANAFLEEKNKELNRSNKDLEQFAYIASHDLQEPVRKIQTFLELLRTNMQDKESAEKYFTKIESSAQRMSFLIKDILNYSRLSKTEKFEDVNLNAIFAAVVSDFEVRISEKNAIIICSSLPTVKGIPSQLSQLFSNLISNALKFSPEEAKINISVRELSKKEIAANNELRSNTNYVELRIKDNGIGFDQQYAEQIFVIFQRLHERQTYSGTGIGLALCKKIVENHNGSIHAISKTGEGAEFIVCLPLS